MDYDGHYCVTFNRTKFNDTWIIKWDLYDQNVSKLGNNNETASDLSTCAHSAFFNVKQTVDRLDVKFLTFVTNWEYLIDAVYSKGEIEDFVKYFKELFLGYNYIVLNVFDTEIINQFYSN